MSRASSFLDQHGWLSTKDNKIVDQWNNPFILRGMSLFWSQWIPKFYNYEAIKWLRDDWKINAIRGAIAVNYGGYRQNPEGELHKVASIVDAAVKLGIYIVIDWHVHELELKSALEFFEIISEEYGNCPNVLYEIWNEPFPKYKWERDIKPYHEAVIPIIRKNAPRSLIVAGTENYSQRVDVASTKPLEHPNVAYSVHFYSASHKNALRLKCAAALDSGAPLLVTEYGTCESTGDGIFAPDETRIWWKFLETHDIGHFNWSIADKIETAAALKPGAPAHGKWSDDMITQSGLLVREYLRTKALQV